MLSAITRLEKVRLRYGNMQVFRSQQIRYLDGLIFILNQNQSPKILQTLTGQTLTRKFR